MNASDVLIETMQAWGVDTVFRLPGDGINGIMETLRKKKAKVRFKPAAHSAESLARGKPDRRKILGTVVENKVRELL